ncbi:preprotein translocase subunit SecY [Trueperella pyogenes]|uniref:Protein translocase subunit SecY n=1 Tax=Trueperella pyogenes TaxID=1661 RepID=X4R9D7_9ACTO|nr:preprotein translocase subunit SecY [Trueperella pyogenes]AHU89394.1 preprotein translocase subunit SecY [Trueperella pyogenes]AJC69213.1 preprotein translocase subunit SecY [Trueperella pyogenes TP8]AWG04201.1 preprotein translocase subunit SecY [Trueperella pyogenes]AWG16928.1 preprotein translocase subunit SecY [Trueperella pyogenes]AZR00823.1 preprotein translocase subunit SecY [Trueperella pyogenes]
MFKALVSAFRTPDLRRKLLFTMMIMAIYRLGTYMPAPFVSYSNVKQCLAEQGTADLLTMMNMFSGGGLLQLSVFALGIMPYITASIIVQLMRVVIPRFEELHKEGQTGQAKLTEYTRYLTIFLAILQASVMVSVANSSFFQMCTVDPIPNPSPGKYLLTILAVTAGTGLVMWLGEQITERGVGNGMSLLIFTGIAASFPTMLTNVYRSDGGLSRLFIVLAMFLAITLVVVFVEQSQRRIPVQYAKRVVGRRTYGGTSTYIPIKINMANVIPVIFASSILALPQMVAGFGDRNSAWVQWVHNNFSNGSVWYLTTYAVLIVFFAFFYTSITFNPEEIADNMKRYGGFVPGIRAGQPTADYLRYVINRINWVGALYLAIIAMIPQVVFNAMGIHSLSFGGTSIIILVGVGLQTVKDIDAQLQQRHYEGFLR